MNFDFLNSVELTVPEKGVRTGRSSAEKNPEGGMLLRVFGSGKIYPSKELVEYFDLEYKNKNVEQGNGFDIFKSTDWPMFPANAPENYVFVCAVNKKSPKVDLFGQVGYETDGEPKSSVLEQGGGSFGSQLLEMIQEIYGIEIPKGEYKDFEINLDVSIKSPNDVYFIPKTVARGENKGKVTVTRREYTPVFPLVPVTDETEPEEAEERLPEGQTTLNFEEPPANVEDVAQPFDNEIDVNSIDSAGTITPIPGQ